jgi:hypothetical protein
VAEDKIEKQPTQDSDNRETWNVPSFKSFDARDAENGVNPLDDGNGAFTQS